MLRRLTIFALAAGLMVACAEDDETNPPAGDATTGGDATDGADADGTDATDGTDTDGTDATDGTDSDGTDATDGTDTDGTDATDGTDTDGTDATDGTDTTDGTDASDGTDSTDGAALGEGNPPTLGAQIDRVGRPAISTALIAPFETDETAKGAAKDAYNAASDPASWDDFAADIEPMLAIYDALDAVCGNQLLAEQTEDAYSFLAGVLSDDRLYLNSTSGNCATYLGVEAQVVGAVADGGCGGRTLGYDVIDMSYTVLATGALDASVGDGVDEDDAEPLAAFPFLPAPSAGQ